MGKILTSEALINRVTGRGRLTLHDVLDEEYDNDDEDDDDDSD